MAKIALYLAGGGARGAYQAGILKAISHILQVKTIPFNMLSGVSVGTINAAILAQHADDFPLGVETLESLWCSIQCKDIYNTSNYGLGKSVMRNFAHLIIEQRHAGNLLDTSPLHEFIDQNVNFASISDHIATGQLNIIEIISSCYETQQTISFYQHHQTEFEDWQYPRHMSKRVDLAREHILASGAIPLFFPTVEIEGQHYGDGSIGLVSPLRGAIHCDVEKILILGTRQQPPAAKKTDQIEAENVGFAHILGNLLQSLFLDNLDRDIELVNHMNGIARMLSIWKKHRSPWRPIEMLHLRPSVDIATIAHAQYQVMPAMLRLLLNFLGAQSHSGDLLSFLLFEKEFTQELIELGYQDTLSNASAVTEFFS